MNSKISLRQSCLAFNIAALSIGLLSCAESLPDRTQKDSAATINNRAITLNNDMQQVFGGGFFPQGLPAFGSIGNTGGFGFSGSIASILGNAGGFGGFGGFGSFASFLAGSLPITPPAGFIPPPGTGIAPVIPAPGAFAGTPPGGFTAPGGGFTPPPGFTPPAAGFTTPPGFTPPISGLPANTVNTNRLTQIGSRLTQINLVDNNLAETNTSLSNTDLDFVFVAARGSNSLLVPFAVTETITDCAGGGTSTLSIEDVDPVGPSAGDGRSTTYKDCARSTGGTILNGSKGFKTDEMIGVPFVDPVWSTKMTMFQNALTRDNTASGYISISNGTTVNSINVDEAGITQNASGTGDESRTNTATDTGYTHTYNFNVDFAWNTAAQDFTINFDIDIQTVAAKNSFITVKTTQPMTGSAGGSPTGGQVTITVGTDAVATQIQVLTAQPDGTVLVESDIDADGVVDTTATLPNWSDALFELFNAPI